MSIFIESLDVEIRIWRHEIENVVLVLVGPVFPADIPSFNQYLIESVLSCEINILAYVLIVRRVFSVRSRLRVVRLAKVNGGEIICI